MQVITAVYLNCRPDLRDEWLTGIEVDDVSDSQVSVFCGNPMPRVSTLVDLYRRKNKLCDILSSSVSPSPS